MRLNVLPGGLRIELSMQFGTVDATVASDIRDGAVDVARADVARANLDDSISDQGFVGSVPDSEIDVMRSPIDPVHDHVSSVVQLVGDAFRDQPSDHPRSPGLPVEDYVV